MIRCGYYFTLAISVLLSFSCATWAEESEIIHGPMIHDPQIEENTRSVKEIVVRLKPHVRTYVDRHYEWMNGQSQHQRDEAPISPEEVRKLSKAAGVKLTLKPMAFPEELLNLREEPPMSEKEARKLSQADHIDLLQAFHTLILPRIMTPKEARAVAARIAKDPDVEYASPSLIGYGMRVPNDALYQSLQWNFQQSAGGVNLPPAWDTDIGGTNIVVAVLDSGILPNHADLVGRTLPGYDFVSDPVLANDGGGRDIDPIDPGNWVTQADIINYPIQFAGCSPSASDWHGSHVAGIIGASSNNSIGVAGVNWISKILPVRISGKCGKGVESDVRDAILWASSIPFTGSPILNPNPAKVINISFGGAGSCAPDLQAAIDAAVKKNVVVVVAAGNAGLSALGYWPGNCNNVVNVGAVTRQGGESDFSNFGSALSLSAPGGAMSAYPIDSIKSTGDSGTTTAANDSAYINFYGTSQAAPHVASVASLMLSARNKLTFKQVRTMLQKTARAFPVGTSSDCTTANCGAGILDAAGAVAAAESELSGGKYHSVALQASGAVLGWGFNGNGQLGDGSALGTIRSYPGPVTGMNSGFIDLAAGDYHNIAVKSDGTVWAWGYNGKGQLGNNTTVDQSIPVQVSTLTGVIATAAGYSHTLALKSDGTVWAWGYNFFGQLGVGAFDFVDRAIPTQVSGLTNMVAIAAGGKRSMALKNDGTVWMWGDAANVSANGTTGSTSAVPLQMAGITDVIAIAAGGDATTGVDVDLSLALKSDGTVWAWGYNGWGQLGNGKAPSIGIGSFLPVQVTGLTDMITIATGGNHAMALKSDGTVWAWGYNADGELGDGTNIYKTTPVQTLGLSKAVTLATGSAHSMALSGDLTIQEWGADVGGQLGNGTTTAQITPATTHGQANLGIINTANATTTQADLSVSLSATPNPILTSNLLTYSFTATNLSTGAASSTFVTLALTGSVTFVSASPACAQSSGTVVCNLGTLNSGASTGLQVVVKPFAAGLISATAYVSSAVVDPNGANNSAAVTTAVNAPVVASDSDVPTLPEWGIILMASLLLVNMVWVNRCKCRS